MKNARAKKMVLSKKTGRPNEGKGKLKNMRLIHRADEFLAEEKQRAKKTTAGVDMTFVVECALLEFAKFKPSVRDDIYRKMQGAAEDGKKRISG